jgi:hypothetical protein
MGLGVPPCFEVLGGGLDPPRSVLRDDWGVAFGCDLPTSPLEAILRTPSAGWRMMDFAT